MRISILHNPVSADANLDDQETLEQVAAVHAALESCGHEVSELVFSLDFFSLIPELQKQKPDVIFNLVESINGSSDLVHFAPLLLEQLRIPFTGGSASNVYQSSNKLIAKHWLRAGKLATPSWTTVTQTSKFADFPAIVKSVTEHGSFGLDQNAIVIDQTSLMNILRERESRLGGAWFAERYIAGREFNIGVIALENEFKILPIAEMQFINPQKHRFNIIDYTMKWQCDDPSYDEVERVFLTENDDLNYQLMELVLNCCRWFDVKGYARVDIRVDEAGQPWILELNLNPSIAPNAGFVAQAAQLGWDYPTVIQKIVDVAVL